MERNTNKNGKNLNQRLEISQLSLMETMKVYKSTLGRENNSLYLGSTLKIPKPSVYASYNYHEKGLVSLGVAQCTCAPILMWHDRDRKHGATMLNLYISALLLLLWYDPSYCLALSCWFWLSLLLSLIHI